jgi:hypothetical protein
MNVDQANLCDLGGAHAALRHMLANEIAERLMRKPKTALRDCDRYFMSEECVPEMVPGGGAPDLVAAVASGADLERQRMHVSVRRRLEERLRR